MDNKIYDIFSRIHAEPELKAETVKFINSEMQRRNKPVHGYMRLAAVCASFALIFFIGGFSYNAYFTTDAYIDIDVNPSVELLLNRFGRVIEAAPYNDGGDNILKDTDVRHKSYDKAVELILEAFEQNGYLTQDGLLSVTVWTENEAREKDVLSGIETVALTFNESRENDAQVDVFAVTEEVKSHSHENHISPAKYIAITELQAIDPTVSFEKCKSHSISELRQLVHTHGVSHGHGYPVNADNNIQERPIETYDEIYEPEKQAEKQEEIKEDGSIAPTHHKRNNGHSKSKGHH